MRLAVILLACGCGRVAFDPLADASSAIPVDAAPDARACVYGPFEGFTAVENVNSASIEFSMSVTEDGRLMVFQSYRTGGGDLYRAERASTATSFAAAQPIAELNTGSMDGAATITADGLEIVFMSTRASARFELYRSRRAARGDPFPMPVLALDSTAVIDRDGPEISADGLTLYYTLGNFGANNREIHRATRSDTNAPFVDAGPVTEVNSTADDALPSVSSDELELFLQSTRDGTNRIWVAHRTSRTVPFGAPVRIPEIDALGTSVSDPEIAGNGDTLYFTRDIGASRDIWLARRACN